MRMKKPNRVESNAKLMENAKSPCCSSEMKLEGKNRLGKPYYSWICQKCKLGWMDTKLTEWNYAQ